MRRVIILAAARALALAVHESAQQRDALKAATHALGADRMKTLQFFASGANFTVGQNFTPADPWPRVTIRIMWRRSIMKPVACGWSCCAKWAQRCRGAAVCRSPASCIKFRRSVATMPGTFRFLKLCQVAARGLPHHARFPRLEVPVGPDRAGRHSLCRLRKARSSACSRSGRRHKVL